MDAVRELRYRPNVMARGLITRRTHTLAFIVPSLNDPFFPEVAEAVQGAAVASDLTMLFALSDNDIDTELDLLSRLEAHAPDGVIVFPSRRATDHLITHLDRGMRMVVIDAQIQHPNSSCVMSDLRAGAHLAVQRLVGLGRRRLAMISNEHSGESTGRRETGFRESLPEGMEPIVFRVDPTFEGGRYAAAALIEQHPDIDGILAYNDVVAIGAMQWLQAEERSIPDDVAVIGCDDIAMGSVITPSLTTIRIDGDRLGREAVHALTALVDGRPIESPRILPVELVLRDSG